MEPSTTPPAGATHLSPATPSAGSPDVTSIRRLYDLAYRREGDKGNIANVSMSFVFQAGSS